MTLSTVSRCSIVLWLTSQQTHQRWIDIETTLIVNVQQRCFNVDFWLKMKVEPTYIYRRCFNVDKTTLKQRRFNIDEPMLFQRWNLVENESWANVCLSTLFQRWNNIERITSIQCRWPSVVSTLIFSWRSKLSQRMFIGVSTLRKQHWNSFVNICCTDVH